MSSGSRRWGCRRVNSSDQCGSIMVLVVVLVVLLEEGNEDEEEDCWSFCTFDVVVGGGLEEEVGAETAQLEMGAGFAVVDVASCQLLLVLLICFGGC